MEGGFENQGYFSVDVIEEGRRDIFKWREKRRSMRTGLRGTKYKITKLFISRSLVRSFMHNLSLVIAFQMLLGGLCTYCCVKLELLMDVNMSLFVSPIVFPLAFSINANYQRRESVLEDLALFKSSSSILFFCHRDWIKATAMYCAKVLGRTSNFVLINIFSALMKLPVDWLKTLSNKLKFLVINIREYLLTENAKQRKFILQAIYEDFSDIAQLNDKIRTSPLKSNSALVARIVHLHNLMCWSFERLRVIREYNSPRSLRAFTKVFIFLMPLLLSPYYVFSGRQTQSTWTPYYISVMVSFLFGSLQSVQDKLDDPFDGIGEDDVKLGQLDEWTTQSLLANRTVTIGRFTVTTTAAEKQNEKNTPVPPLTESSNEESSPTLRTHPNNLVNVGRRFPSDKSPTKIRRILSRKGERNLETRRPTLVELDETEFTDQLEARCRGLASKLEGRSGTTIILPGNRVPYIFQDNHGLKFPEALTSSTSQPRWNRLDVVPEEKERKISAFRFDNQLDVVRESDGEVSDAWKTPGTSPEILQNMKCLSCDEVARNREESGQKRPTVLGLFTSPEGNMQFKVSENTLTNPDDLSSPGTCDVLSPISDEASSPIKTELSTSNTNERSPSVYSSEELPLLPLNSSTKTPARAESGIEALTTSYNTAKKVLESGLSDRIEGDTSDCRKSRFCLRNNRGIRSRKSKKQSPSQDKCEPDSELAGTNSSSLLLENHEFAFTESEGSDCVNDEIANLDSTGSGKVNNGNAEYVDVEVEPEEGHVSLLKHSENYSTVLKPVDNECDVNPAILINSSVEEKSSLWDFDLSADKDDGVQKDSCKVDGDGEVNKRILDVAASSPSICQNDLCVLCADNTVQNSESCSSRNDMPSCGNDFPISQNVMALSSQNSLLYADNTNRGSEILPCENKALPNPRSTTLTLHNDVQSFLGGTDSSPNVTTPNSNFNISLEPGGPTFSDSTNNCVVENSRDSKATKSRFTVSSP